MNNIFPNFKKILRIKYTMFQTICKGNLKCPVKKETANQYYEWRSQKLCRYCRLAERGEVRVSHSSRSEPKCESINSDRVDRNMIPAHLALRRGIGAVVRKVLDLIQGMNLLTKNLRRH